MEIKQSSKLNVPLLKKAEIDDVSQFNPFSMSSNERNQGKNTL